VASGLLRLTGMRSLLGLFLFLTLGACGGASHDLDECDGGDFADGCDYQGVRHPTGEVFPAGDGCNTCSCTVELGLQCSIVACPTAPTTARPAPQPQPR
jgi:hypothetical protein